MIGTCLALILIGVHGAHPEIENLIFEQSQQFETHPLVKAPLSQSTCAKTLDRLKRGPEDIPQIIFHGNSDSNYKYTD